MLTTRNETTNCIAGWSFAKDIRSRMAKMDILNTKTNRVDVLVTGCEVSLWIGEQFAADLALVYPGLIVKAMSSNKILGLLGQSRPMQASGFMFTEETWDLSGCIVLIVSHSGGTFSPLAVSNLLQSETSNIYVATRYALITLVPYDFRLDAPNLQCSLFFFYQ